MIKNNKTKAEMDQAKRNIRSNIRTEKIINFKINKIEG
jgi:hypothetical protein